MDQEVADARQRERYRLLSGLRKITKKKAVKRCKTPIGNSNVGLVEHPGGAHFVGVQSCANVWACPVCAPKIRASRTTDVMEAVERHTAAGGGLVFLTLTLPHNLGDRLALLLGLLSDAWTYVTRQRGYKAWRDRVGLIGNIGALEVTHGGSGWHPHRHLLMFTERPLSVDMVAAWEADLHALYNRLLAKKGWKASMERIGVRMDLVTDPSAAVAKYISKVQAGFELTRTDLKKSRSASGLMPFDLLAYAMEDHERSEVLWLEYEQAMTGKSAVRFTKGLRSHLEMESGKTDEELAEEEVGGEAGMYLTAPLQRRLISDGHGATVLQAYARTGDLGVLQLVERRYPGRYIGTITEEYGGRLLLGEEAPPGMQRGQISEDDPDKLARA